MTFEQEIGTGDTEEQYEYDERHQYMMYTALVKLAYTM
jgi:hypothetical protein